MKTTVELPDHLLIEAKKRAAELRVTLRSLIESGLRAQLEKTEPAHPQRRRDIEWVTVDGGLPRGLDVRDRSALAEWLHTGGRQP